MGGSTFPNIDPEMYKKIAGDPRLADLAKKYNFSIPATMPNFTPPPAPVQWSFPQYSQTWAFTPPKPSPLQLPPPFDPKTYGKSSSGDRDGDGGSGGGRRRAADGILHRPGSYHGP